MAKATLTVKVAGSVGALMLICTAAPADAKYERSQTVKRIFRSQHPCPATHKNQGACPGFVIDHIKPLCVGGEDNPRNLQWQTIEAAKAKDRLDREQCKGRR